MHDYLMRSSQPRMFFGLPGRVTMATTDSATTALLGTRLCKAQRHAPHFFRLDCSLYHM